jgi:transcriptional regulator with XRE-family HTH domain
MPAFIRPVNQPARNREIVGSYLKQERLRVGLTQVQMLEAIGQPLNWHTGWSAIESGSRNLPPRMWMPVADVLGIPQDDFARVLLRHTHPWAFAMIYGMTPELRAELNQIPTEYSEGPHRKRRAKSSPSKPPALAASGIGTTIR